MTLYYTLQRIWRPTDRMPFQRYSVEGPLLELGPLLPVWKTKNLLSMRAPRNSKECDLKPYCDRRVADGFKYISFSFI